MIARSPQGRGRSGITLTEILISILIMGIGLISLATLFPLGLIRLRDASRFHRGGLLVQSATDDMDARSLLFKPSFQQTWYGVSNDPFTIDAVVPGSTTTPVTSISSTIPLPGLPVAYDPLWRAVTNIVPQTGVLNDPTLSFKAAYCNGAAEARFGCGVVYSPSGAVSNPFNLGSGPGDAIPSAYGLQRITNFIPWDVPANGANALYPFTYANMSLGAGQAPDVAGDTFSSIDDMVFNAADGGVNAPSSLLPDMQYAGTPVVDWRYTWMFTGRQVDSTNNTMFQGEIVVFDGRPFGFEPMVDVTGTVTPPVATGETLVEAIFGFSTNVNSAGTVGGGATVGFANGSDRTVLLRWSAKLPDPQIRIGGWIADVTYERDSPTSASKIGVTGTPFQRCYWYQVVKRTDGEAETPQSTGPNTPGYRRMTLTLATPVRAKTLMFSTGQNNAGTPYYTNVALVMPSVINVFPRAFQIH